MRQKLIDAMSHAAIALANLAALREHHVAESKISPTGEDLLGDIGENIAALSHGLRDMADDMMSGPSSVYRVTNIQIYPVSEPKGKLRAYARVLLGDQLQLTGLKVYEGSNGLFVAYPSDEAHKGEDYRQIFYPVTRELRDQLEKAILDEYNSALQS